MATRRYNGSTEVMNIMLVGDSTVGKSSIIQRYTVRQYYPYHEATIGLDFKQVPYRGSAGRFRLHIWDTAGMEKYNAIAYNFYKKADAFVIVYDISRDSSYQNVKVWMQRIATHGKENAEMLVVGNKCDVKQESREVSYPIAESFCKQHNLTLMEVSAATGDNIDNIFDFLVEKIRDERRSRISKNPSIQMPNGLLVGAQYPYTYEPDSQVPEKPRPLCC